MCLCFGFEETKLAKGKLCGELRSVLKYNFKDSKNETEFSDFANKYSHVESPD